MSDLDKLANDGSALYANRFLIGRRTAGLRIAFIENSGDESDAFRTAVIVSYEDAKALHKLMGAMLYPDTEKKQ